MGLTTAGCTDNVCHDQAICGNHNGHNSLGSDASASSDSEDSPDASTPADSETPSVEATSDSPDSGSAVQDSSTDSDQSTDAPPTRPSRPESVSLWTLCQSNNDVFDCGGFNNPRTVSVGDHTFNYVGETNPNDHSTGWKIVMGMASTTCSTITLQFASGDSQTKVGREVRLRLTQEHAAAVEESAKDGTIGKLTANIAGGASFKIEGSASYDTNVLVNGSAMCTTVSGT
ncbi:hypothetical protein [Streptomyces cellostaticus]|uniref:hypothetical protein n=1 Tax=Streptomyces cellostaticus TaxID=67285 RepID=UPI0020270B28|nr:hypothetical protein [Streptomyces cellostaticus]